MGAAGNKKPKKSGKHDKHTPAYEVEESKLDATSIGSKKKK